MHGARLAIVRFGWGLWVATAVGALAVYACALPDWFDQLRTAAATSPGPASYSLTADEIAALEQRGITRDFYALAVVAAQTVAVVFAVVVGAVIVWRRSDDWLALLVGLWLILIPTNAPVPPGAVLAEANRAWFGPVYGDGQRAPTSLRYGRRVRQSPRGRWSQSIICTCPSTGSSS